MKSEIIKSIPLSIEGYTMSVEKYIYEATDNWSISARLLCPNHPQAAHSITMESTFNESSLTEEQALAEMEVYLTKLCEWPEAVDKVVDWWAKVSFDTLLNQNNGDQSPNGGIAFILMNQLSMRAQSKVTPEKVQVFKDHLRAGILDEWNRELHVDYHGDRLLTNALDAAGIDHGCLPIKTYSMINLATNVATASLGYHGKTIFI